MDQNNNMPGDSAGNNASPIPLVGGIILVIVLAILGWYLLKGQGTPTVTSPTETVATPQVEQSAAVETDSATAALASQGTSDEVATIDQDLNATDLNTLNDINQI